MSRPRIPKPLSRLLLALSAGAVFAVLLQVAPWWVACGVLVVGAVVAGIIEAPRTD